jgi:hypothetical protein
VGNTLLKINVKKENSLHYVMDSYDKNISTYFKKLDVYISTYISEIAKCETLNLKKIKGFHELRDLLYKIDYFAYAKYLSINCEIKLREAISNYLYILPLLTHSFQYFSTRYNSIPSYIAVHGIRVDTIKKELYINLSYID